MTGAARTRLSAGVLLHRRRSREIEVLLIHPGGPYWKRRHDGAWQIPKGGVERGEAPLQAALREFAEELGSAIEGPALPLGQIRQAGGKWVEAYAVAGDIDPAAIVSIEFDLEWPPRSGRIQRFPEVDAARWFTLAEARGGVMLPSQLPLLDRLEDLLAGR